MNKIIINECDCPSHTKHHQISSINGLSGQVVIKYNCTRCHRRGIIEIIERTWGEYVKADS